MTAGDAPEPARCRTCRAPIMWAVSAKTGSRMPLDRDPVDNGNVVLDGNRASYLSKADAAAPNLLGEARYVSHFATCPQAQAHRKGKR